MSIEVKDCRKCPMNNKGICERGCVPLCKFAKDCMVSPLVYSLLLREKSVENSEKFNWFVEGLKSALKNKLVYFGSDKAKQLFDEVI